MSRIDQGIEGQEGTDFADDHDDAHGNGRMVASDADDRGHDGAADHGKESDESRCTAGTASLVLHSHGKTAGAHHGQRRYGQEQEDHDDRQRHAGTEGCQQGHAADSGQEQGKPQEFPVSNAACQPARNGTVDHEADTIDAKDEAESLSRYAVDVLENKGRSGNIGKKGGKSKALHDTMTHEIRLTEQGRKAVQTGRHATGNASPLRQGFTHQTGRYGQEQPDNGNEKMDELGKLTKMVNQGGRRKNKVGY